MEVEGRIVSQYNSLVIHKFIHFMLLFRHNNYVFCFFLLTIFLHRVWNMQHIAAYTKAERTAKS